MQGLVRTSTGEAGCHQRVIFWMYMFQPFNQAGNLLRVETEDLSCILAEPYFVGRHFPIEGDNSAGPQRPLQSFLVQSPLAKKGPKNQRGERDRQNGGLGPQHTLLDRQLQVPENAD